MRPHPSILPWAADWIIRSSVPDGGGVTWAAWRQQPGVFLACGVHVLSKLQVSTLSLKVFLSHFQEQYTA